MGRRVIRHARLDPMSDASMVSLVVTDLDGTFWHTDDHLDDAVLDAVAGLDRAGIPLLVATGRRLTSTREPLAKFGLTPPAVVLNGALGVDLATGERFHRAPYEKAQAIEVLNAFRSVGLDPVVYIDDPALDAYISNSPSTHKDHVRAMGSTAQVDDLDRVVNEEAVLGFSMIGVPFSDGEAADEAIGGLAEPHLDRSIDFVGYCSFTVAPRGQSKWDGVLAFCAAHRLDSGRVLALADGPNDIELLERSAVRLVPKVAHPSALERADVVVGAAADGGWAEVLDHLSLPGGA